MTIEEARERYAHFLIDRGRYGTRFSPDEIKEQVAVMKATQQKELNGVHVERKVTSPSSMTASPVEDGS